MVRINLLPAEIIEKRRWRKFYPYLFITAAILAGVVIVTWAVMQILITQRNDQLQQTQETVASLQGQAQSLAIFEAQKQQLEARKDIAESALAGRIDMGKLMEELSMILPDSVWADAVKLEQNTGVALTLNTPDSVDAELGDGYKSVAATLVRINSLKDLYDVWLTQASSGDYEAFQGDAEGQSAKTITFDVTAKITRPATQTAAPAVPAPPTTTGQ